MAGDAPSKAFTVIRPPPGMEIVGPGQQLHLRLNVGPLKEIFVYYDPLDGGGPEHKRGYVRFYPTSEHRPVAQLVFSWFPPGTWRVKLSEPDQSGAIYATSIEPGWTNAGEKVVAAFQERLKSLDLAIGWEFTDLPKSKKSIAMQKAEVTEAVRSAAEKGREILLKVAYDRSDGDVGSLLKSEPVHGDKNYLLDEPLARIFLEFVEHFGNIEVDHSLARGGLTEEKLKKLGEPNPAVVEAIANLFTQGYGEFEWSRRSARPTPSLEEFKQMEEAIFFQARVKNDLARRNLLRVGIGSVRDKKGKREDIGVVRRPCVSGAACEGAPRWLLYDRHGVAVPVGGGVFRDPEYRSVDLEKLKREAVFPIPAPSAPGILFVRGIPIVEIDVQNRRLYAFLRELEQSLGGPPRELVALAASLFNYGLFIAREMHERNKALMLAGRTIEFAAGVFVFFIIHAMAAALKASRHPGLEAAGYLLMAMARAAGAILGVDFALSNIEKLALAGRHFAQMERLHRESAESAEGVGNASGGSSGGQGGRDPVEIPRLAEAKLDKLSQGHLKAGSEALLDAMADYFALGVVLVGGVGVAKLRRMRAAAKEAKALQEHIKDLEADAHSKLKVSDDGAVEEIEPLKPADQLEGVPAPRQGKPAKPAGGLGAEKPPADGNPKLEKKKPEYGEYFYKACEALRKRVEVPKEHLDSLGPPSEAGRAQKLEALKKKAGFLLNSVELMRSSKGERAMSAISKEVAEFETEVAKEFPPPGQEEAARESEGLYVIQEPGELQGEPQRGKVPEQVAKAQQGAERKIRTRVADADPRTFTFLDVNPGYPEPGRTENCANCAVALDRTLGGRPSVAGPSEHGFTMGEIEAEMGGRFAKTDFPSLEIDLTAAGGGARGIVAARNIASRRGHVFNAINIEGEIRFIDSQNGKIYDEPAAIFCDWYFMRTDSL